MILIGLSYGTEEELFSDDGEIKGSWCGILRVAVWRMEYVMVWSWVE
jgi:hypothetical protein